MSLSKADVLNFDPFNLISLYPKVKLFFFGFSIVFDSIGFSANLAENWNQF